MVASRSPLAPRPSNATSPAQGSSQADLLAMTVSLAASSLRLSLHFFGAVIAADYSFQKLRTGLGISVRECGTLVTALLALLFSSIRSQHC